MAQDSLQFKLQSIAVFSSNELVPLWLHTNQYGKIEKFGQGQLLAYFGSEYKYQLNKKLQIQLGVDGWINNNTDESAIGQLYLKLKWQNFSFIIGKKNLDYLLDQDKEISFLNFKNIRSMPAISFGFFNYTPVPLTQKYLYFKASFLQGILNDNRTGKGISDPYYHFKSLYMKTGNLPVNLFVGLNHSVIFGGTMADGTKIPTDLINTYLISSSKKLEAFNWGEGANKPGENIGLAEIGIEYETENYKLTFSKQDPMSDLSGLFDSKDLILQFKYQAKKHHWLESFSYQYASFKHQSGPGLHLKSYEKYANNYSKFLADNYGLDVVVNSWDEVYPYLIEYVNHGYKEFGRDNYFNHFIYKLGHSYDGQFFTYPLMHTADQIAHFDDIDDLNYEIIGNNRLVAHHFFINGSITPTIQYDAKLSFSKNFGTYSGYYTTGFNERENYYFKNGKNQNYYSIKLIKTLPKHFHVHATIAYDQGDLYQSWGLMLGISHTISPF